MGKNKKQNNSNRSVERTKVANEPEVQQEHNANQQEKGVNKQEKNASKEHAANNTSKDWSADALKKIKWGTYALLFIFAMGLLGGYNYEFLYKTQNYNLFLGNSIFFHETMQHSSGLLIYVSHYLTQFLYYPWLGATILSLGLVGMTKLVELLRGSESKWWGLNFVPALFTLLTQTSIGYTLYCNFDNSFLVLLELGVLIALALAIGMKQLMQKFGIGGCIASLITSSLLYFAIGLFGPLAALIAGANILSNNKKNGVTAIVGSLGIESLMAYLSSTYYINEEYARAWFSPLPDSVYCNLFYLSVVTLITNTIIAGIKKTGTLQKRELYINAGIVVIGMLGVYYLTNRDNNFKTELKLQHLTDKQDWNNVIETANQVEHPTNTIAAYRFLALNQTDRLWTEVFNYPVRLDTISSPYKDITELGNETDLYFYCSLPHKAYRWEMEKWVTTGRNFEELKHFVIYALIRDEQALAHKYIDLLKQSTFYKGWAEDYEKYIGHRDQLFADFPSFKKVVDREVKENIYTQNTNLQLAYAKYKHPTPEQLQFRLMLDLYYLNMDQFVADFSVAKDMYTQQMPSYLQEAVTIYAMKINNPNILRMFPINPQVVQQTQNFFSEFSQYKNDKEAGAKAMERYKGTFVYHMIYSNLYEYKQKNK